MAVSPDSVVALARRGRPRSIVAHSSVSTWVPAPVHDALIRLAEARGVSVSRVAADALKRSLSPTK